MANFLLNYISSIQDSKKLEGWKHLQKKISSLFYLLSWQKHSPEKILTELKHMLNPQCIFNAFITLTDISKCICIFSNQKEFEECIYIHKVYLKDFFFHDKTGYFFVFICQITFIFLPMWLIMIYQIFPKQPLADTFDS